MSIKPGKVLGLPKLLGYFDNKVLFANGKGDVTLYQVDDEASWTAAGGNY